MVPLLISAAAALALASRPLVIRLWARGMVPDRIAAALLLARTPLLVFATALILSAPVLLVVAGVVVAAIPPALGYPVMLRLLRERASKAPGSTDGRE